MAKVNIKVQGNKRTFKCSVFIYSPIRISSAGKIEIHVQETFQHDEPHSLNVLRPKYNKILALCIRLINLQKDIKCS